MEVILNGCSLTIDQSSTLNDLINSLDIEGKFAVEINQNIIPQSGYSSTEIHANDVIEIVHAIGGG